MRVGTYKAALDVAHYETPQTPAQARFSLKYVVASALVHGSVRLAASEPARIEDPATRDLMQRIDVAVDPQLDAAFPAQRAARVRIESSNGRSEEHLQPTRKGDPDAPLSDEELNGKYLELASPVLGEARARRLLARLWRLERETQLDFSSVNLAQALFAPRAVALVGASGDPAKNTARPQRFLRKHGYAGRIVPINPTRGEVLGERAYPSLAQAPEGIDHVFVMAPGDAVERALEDCGARGVPVMSVFSDGFADAGADGMARQMRLAARARARRAAARPEQHGRDRHSGPPRAHRERGA